MSKKMRVVLLFSFVIALFIAAPAAVLACSPGGTSSPDEEWIIYSEGVKGEIIQFEEIHTSPRGNPQLMNNGIEINGSSQLCIPFYRGRFGWVGTIYQQVDEKWVKLPTTSGYVPNGEGLYLACATAKSAGTYALFAYYKD